MPNAVIECITSRRSIRRFKAEQIRDEELSAILNAAAWAPSGGNSQSWMFTVIQNAKILTDLNDLLRRTFLTWLPDDNYPSKHKAKVNAQNEKHNYFYHAPTLVVFSNVPDYGNSMADCSCAAQNLFLAAHSLGLGSCWINQLRWLRNDPPLREMLAQLRIPRNYEICLAAAVGYPDHTPPAPERKGEGPIFWR